MKINTDNVARLTPPPAEVVSNEDKTAGAGAVLKDLRLKKGMKQSELCKNAKVSQSSLTNIEGGKQTLSFAVFCDIVDALGVDFELTFTDKPKKPFPTPESVSS
jgi:transcriptional regulator with XRE-family HTH domain